ncbi:MAG: hypothetical protein M0R34_08585 [Candidatus Marinimicrobia bacterium]|jgi:hypothetical protein|nr:hypothetical protein [Candidatus Neomarinimicrobiota bacterium]MCK9484405.1 hypothetical protein [Candidatus Neomarinimicrobiota bacterium]MCK9560488.1 hypothetical protein [Candidatus Neomarinimicrobiota bacterium]
MRSKNIIFSIDISDIQNVAEQELERSLTQEEIELVKETALSDDYFGWYDGIVRIFQRLQLT